jgi:hypothetical protein
MLAITVRTEIPLAAPDIGFGLVTWLDVIVRQFDAPGSDAVAQARVAMIHVADAKNQGVSLRAVLETASAELLALYDVFFATDNFLKEEFQNGFGWNLMYFQHLEVSEPWRGRTIEEAVVRRIVSACGDGSAIAVMPVPTDVEARRWHRVGFEAVRAPELQRVGYAYLDLAREHPKISSADDDGHRFEIETLS